MGDIDGGPRTPGESHSHAALDRLQAIALTSVATILTVHGTALAAADATRSPQATCIDAICPLLDPGTLAATGTAIATLGAYRLMRAARRGQPPAEGDARS